MMIYRTREKRRQAPVQPLTFLCIIVTFWLCSPPPSPCQLPPCLFPLSIPRQVDMTPCSHWRIYKITTGISLATRRYVRRYCLSGVYSFSTVRFVMSIVLCIRGAVRCSSHILHY